MKDLIDNPHPVYIENARRWLFYLSSYEGGAAYSQAQVNVGQSVGVGNKIANFLVKVFAGGKEVRGTSESNLFRHAKETDQDYQVRQNMSQYFNFCGPVVDIYTSHIFKEPIVEDWGNIATDIEQREKDINRMGDSIAEYRKEIAELCAIYGHVYTLVDHPKAMGAIRNRLDKMEQNNFPYFTIIHPQNVVNWACDRFGRYHWVLVREIDTGNLDPSDYDKEKVKLINYRVWTRTEWILLDEDGKEQDRGNHNLGFVPINVSYNKRSKMYKTSLGISDLADISFITRDIYNSVSELRQILRDQTFAFLAVQGTSDEYDELSLGTNKALLYPEDRNAPQYVSPPSDNAKIYMEHIDKQVRRIYQLAKLDGGSAKQEKQVQSQSGIAKAFDHMETNNALSSKADNLQEAEMKSWGMFAAWLGKPEFDGTVNYPDNFDIQTLNDDVDLALNTLKLNIGAEYRKAVNTAIVKKQFPRMPEEDMQNIINDIDSNTGANAEGNRILDRVPGLLRNRNGTPQGGDGNFAGRNGDQTNV